MSYKTAKYSIGSSNHLKYHHQNYYTCTEDVSSQQEDKKRIEHVPKNCIK